MLISNLSIAHKQSGVSLIEILITTLILGIGLLGVAALQVSSISSNQEGFFTSQATSIAEDLASRIRSGKLITMTPDPNARIDHATYIANYVNAGAINCGAAPARICRNDGANAANNCTLAEISTFDQWEACSIAEATLPQGEVRIVNQPPGSRRLSIVVDWDSASERADMGNLKNVNVNCAAITNNADRNCIIVELLP